MHEIARSMIFYKKRAKRAPAAPRVRAGSSRPAALPVEAAAVLEVSEPVSSDPESDVEVGLELEVPDAVEPPDVMLPPEVLLLLEPPVVAVPLLPPITVPFPTAEEGTTATGTRVVLATAGLVLATTGVVLTTTDGVPAGEVATSGCVMTAVGCVVTGSGWLVTTVGTPVTTPREFVRLVKRDAG